MQRREMHGAVCADDCAARIQEPLETYTALRQLRHGVSYANLLCAVTTSKQQFEQGLRAIHSALSAALDQKGVHNHSISYTVQGSDPRVPDATFKVAANGRIGELMFTNEEVKDSAERIIRPDVAAKIRHLVDATQ
jgi:hypothetical protein